MVKKLLTVLLIANFLKMHSQQNLDFESIGPGFWGAIPGWTIGASNSYISTTGYCSVMPVPNSGSVAVVTTPYNLGGGTPSVVPNSPLGGTNVAWLSSAGLATNGLLRMSQTFAVTSANRILTYAYFAIVNGGDHNNCCGTHYCKIRVEDCSANAVPCGSLAILPTTTLCPNTGTIGMVTTTMISLYTPNWLVRTLDLSPYIGSCVTIHVESSYCLPSGHFPDLFFDATTAPSIVSTSSCNSNATLTSAAANSYSWSGPGSFTSSNQSIVTSTPGIYTISISNPGCGSLTQTVVANVIPSTTITATSQTLCAGMATTLTALGGGTYSWSTGSTSSSIAVAPLTSTVYTVTATSGSCVTTKTIGISVSPCTGVQQFEVQRQALSISPNPSGGSVRISSTLDAEITICDQLGKKIKVISLNHSNDRNFLINGLSEGIYFVSDGIIIKKLIVLD